MRRLAKRLVLLVFQQTMLYIQVLGSAYHNRLRAKEAKASAELETGGSRAHFYHFFNSHGNHEPLLGIPFPW